MDSGEAVEADRIVEVGSGGGGVMEKDEVVPKGAEGIVITTRNHYEMHLLDE